MRRFRKSILALAVAVSLLQWSVIPAAFAETLACGQAIDPEQVIPSVTAQPDVGPDIRRYFNDPATDPELSTECDHAVAAGKNQICFHYFQ